FVETTNSAGIQSVDGISFGASWGDLNQDTLPDLWVSDHFNPIRLHLNQGNGTFTDIAPDVFQDNLSPSTDTHGAAWADFDNDGDSDLVQFVGAGNGMGSEANFFFVNTLIERQTEETNDLLTELASELGVDYPEARSRTPLWFDIDADGWLDLITSSPARPDGQAPPTIFRQTETGFEDVGEAVGFDVTESDFSMIADLFGDGRPELFTSRRGRVTVFEVGENPLEEPFERVTDPIFEGLRAVEDIAFADFNNDQLLDIYLTRSGVGGVGLNQFAENGVKASLNPRAEEDGFQFNTSEDVTFTFRSGDVDSSQDIYIGSTGINPNGFQFTLSPEDPNVQGILPHNAGEIEGIYIGYDPEQEQWQVLYSQPSRGQLRVRIDSEETITNLTALGFDPEPQPLDDILLMNTGNGFEDRSSEAGLDTISIVGRNVTSGDFDNDQDTDLYIVSTRPAGNIANILLENQGDGTFVAVPDTGGASGTALGIGDSVATADYNLDGFLDLFVTNALFPGVLASDGPDQLFQNEGSDNSWLLLDLVGTESNRDGIGARVSVTSNGVTQLQEQNGGIHRRSQNHQRLHFGLGDNQTIDELVIQWPSGIEQRLENVPANQILEVTEPERSEPTEVFSPGQPELIAGTESGVFLWKETFDGPYSLRTSGDGDLTTFDVNLITTDELTSVNPVELEPNDVWTVSEFGASLKSSVIDQLDGFDFQLTPGQSALLSVTQDGVADSEQLIVGPENISLTPAGWILPSDDLPQRPDFTPGQDNGLFVGQASNQASNSDPDSNTIEFRWSGDGDFRSDRLTAITADEANYTPVDLDGGGPGLDVLNPFANGVEITANVGTEQDGLDITLAGSTQVGFVYEQDGNITTSAVNPAEASLGTPNAYWIPLPSPEGEPDYDPLTDVGLFLWQDQENIWHLRATGDSDGNRYRGTIVSDQAAIQVEPFELEPNDTLDNTDATQIEFGFTVLQGLQDGFDFQFPDGASLLLNLNNSRDDITSLVRIGSEQWPIGQDSVDLSAWT
ncbi:MAG: CRTAC1 family protein, partial [Cyanobacteria bacterium J06592_8]